MDKIKIKENDPKIVAIDSKQNGGSTIKYLQSNLDEVGHGEVREPD